MSRGEGKGGGCDSKMDGWETVGWIQGKEKRMSGNIFRGSYFFLVSGYKKLGYLSCVTWLGTNRPVIEFLPGRELE